jgi:glycerol-3-phosphate acyltransferase PlsY
MGTILFAQVAGVIYDVDISSVGSGNLGATNVKRTLGKKVAIAVFIGDALKPLMT